MPRSAKGNAPEDDPAGQRQACRKSACTHFLLPSQRCENEARAEVLRIERQAFHSCKEQLKGRRAGARETSQRRPPSRISAQCARWCATFLMAPSGCFGHFCWVTRPHFCISSTISSSVCGPSLFVFHPRARLMRVSGAGRGIRAYTARKNTKKRIPGSA